MNKVFKDQIERNLEVYVDDMLIKPTSHYKHFANLKEIFQEIIQNNLKVNPSKYAFNVTTRNFLGFMPTK